MSMPSMSDLQPSREAGPIQQQFNAMVRAGRRADVRAKADSIATGVSENVKAVHADQGRSDSWKNDEAAKLKAAGLAAFESWLERESRSMIAEERSDYARAFGLDGLPGDAATLAISRRDAADRVENVTEPIALRRLLERATHSGDEVLARAVAEKAFRNRDADTLHKFLADRPHVDAAVERLWKGAEREGDSFELALMRMSIKQ